MINDLRQLRFPRALRIPRHLAPDAERLLLQLLRPTSTDAGARTDVRDLVADVATRAWEIAIEIRRLGPDAPQFLRRAAEGLDIALRRHDVEIQDFAGREFDHRENWDRVVSSPRQKNRPFVARMLAPRVFFRGSLLRGGVPLVEDREEER